MKKKDIFQLMIEDREKRACDDFNHDAYAMRWREIFPQGDMETKEYVKMLLHKVSLFIELVNDLKA